MKKLRVAVIGSGTKGISLYNFLKGDNSIEVVAVAQIIEDCLNINALDLNGVIICHTVEELLTVDGLQIIFETTGEPDISAKLHALTPPSVQVVELSCFQLFNLIMGHTNTVTASLLSLMESVDDGVQIVDQEGLITYVNSSFLTIAGLSCQDVVGHSIFEVAPETPIAKSLKQAKCLSGEKYLFKDSSTEVSFHCAPLFTNNIGCGAIGIYRELNDVKRLVKELRRTRTIIENLYERLANTEDFPNLADTDVIPIDHMEQVLLQQALTKFGYSVEGKKMAAKALNISLATLYNKLKKYQIS